MTKNRQLLAKMGGGSLALLLSLSLGQQASAAMLVSNLPPTTNTVAGYAITFDKWLTSSFTTGSASDGYIIGSVTLRLAELTASPNLYVGIWRGEDLGGEIEFPGQQRLRFTYPSFTPNTTNNYTFTAITPQKLAANTNYSLVVGISEGPGEYLWGYTVSPDQTGFTGWSIEEDPLISFNQGGTWQGQHMFSSPISAFQFSVASAAVPEPSSPVPVPGTYALLASSLAVLAAVKRRRRISA